jgi:hypothetical protein
MYNDLQRRNKSNQIKSNDAPIFPSINIFINHDEDGIAVKFLTAQLRNLILILSRGRDVSSLHSLQISSDSTTSPIQWVPEDKRAEV